MDTSPGVRLTYDDFLLFPDDGLRHELIDGAHVVTPSPVVRHQLIAGNLYWFIRGHLERHPVGRILFASTDVVLSRHDIVVPDLLYVSHSRAASVVTRENLRGAPELVIEIASPGTRRRDESVKLRLYERSGVVEYWIVDPARDSIRVYRRVGEPFGTAIELPRTAGAVLTTPLLPGLELPLEKIFTD